MLEQHLALVFVHAVQRRGEHQFAARQEQAKEDHVLLKGSVTAVTLRFKVSEISGKLIEESADPSVYLHGGYGNTLPKVEEALEGQEAGYQVTLDLQPLDAFGVRDESLLQTIPKSQFPPGVKIGGQLEGRGKDGSQHIFNVVKIKGDVVMLDGNHPLAGKALRFNVKVVEVRAATDEEITHRHVHGEHGHHH